MNGAHFHLVLNHIPVLGGVLTFVLICLAVFQKNNLFLKLSFMWMILIGILTIPAYLTGGPAEEIIEKLLGESAEPFIEIHEQFAFYSLVSSEAVALLALWSWIQFRRTNHRNQLLGGALIAIAAINLVLMLITSNLGGQIRHTETRAGFDVSEPAKAPAR